MLMLATTWRKNAWQYYEMLILYILFGDFFLIAEFTLSFKES